jgi:hypothetical protein
VVSPGDINMIRDMGHLDITYNKDIALQYLSFNLRRKCVTVVMYFIISISPYLSIHNWVSSLNLFNHLEIERIYI